MQKAIISFVFLLYLGADAQTHFTQQDTLRGSITKERAWWDVVHYDLNVRVFPKTKSIVGRNTIFYKVLKPYQTLQIELQQPLVIDSILQNQQKLSFQAKGYSYFIKLKKEQKVHQTEELHIYYHGIPKEAIKAPWDGGFVWSSDHNQQPFIATANQSIGPSVWWPCKDHPYDEPSSANITITCPSNLQNISNGRNTKTVVNTNGTTSYTWQVKNPINNYGISINIANYTHFSEVYHGEKGALDCNYYVLKENETKAKTHFKDATRMLQAFEYWMGPYPFYEDGYKIVEVPYLGMEHQSCVAYGNQYKKGYLGHRMGTSTWSDTFDFIIIHESGHEWFANNISCSDVADLWIHEAFTSYSESLFLDYHYGTKAANEYVQGLRSSVKNDKPVLGIFHVHHEGSMDMYPKGSLMLHTLRQIIDDDILWRKMLRGLGSEFYHQTVNGKQIIDYLDAYTKVDLQPFFKHYLTTTTIPKLLLKTKGNKILYKWENVVKGFKIPVKATLNNKTIWLHPSDKKWKKLKGNSQELKIDPNFYIDVILE
ncbi:M1 family metallopeptidase [Ochrovirga pacifica]|uniref:M1 family metallopeptidase n=1 Tax=Ochrovirga pacifica TaxID=1042376 RepID=UPI0002558ED0|nr:M1 family metallopeptidase [Ochrovirga pacifica]